MTISHTASLAGGNAASEAFFDAIGVGVVHSIEELLGGLSLLHCFGQIDDPSLMTMSCSGGSVYCGRCSNAREYSHASANPSRDRTDQSYR